MIVAMIDGNHTQYPDHCACHAEQPNGVGICGHNRYIGSRDVLFCNYINTPAELISPPDICPLVKEPMGNLRMEMIR